MSASGSMDLQRKQMVSSLCKHFSLDHTKLSSDVLKSDLRALYLNLVKSSGTERENNDAVMKWVDFAVNFTAESKACSGALNKLNENLASISVLLGDGLTPSGADVIVYSTVHSSVIGLSNSDKTKLRHIIRWMDYVQMKENLIELFERIPIERPEFVPQGANNAAKLAVDSNTKKTVQDAKSTEKSETDPSAKKSDAGKKSTLDKEAPKEKKKSPDAAVDKEKEVSVSLLKIQVGLIRKCWKHPSADSLLVEEIDVADAKLRQVVSGLAKYCNPDELMNQRVVLITNVKPGKLRDVMSEGLVLCASNEDHTIVEPLLAPEGAKLGECILFPGIDGKPEDVLNPKKKQLEKITPHFFTDDKGVATFKGIPFMTSAGPCTSSIPKASIK